MSDRNTDRKITRAEWISAGSLVIAVLNGAYLAGVEVQRLNDHDRRIAGVERAQEQTDGRIEAIGLKVERIDANTKFLADLAREQRQRER